MGTTTLRQNVPQSITETKVKPNWFVRDANGLLLVAAFLFALIYYWFWPLIYTTMDEAGYVGNAYLLRQGTVYADIAKVFVATNISVDGHYVSKYPLGMAALIAGISFAGWKVALGVNLFVHLANYAVFVRLLRRIRVPGIFALLYLLHPTATLYSRTAMADLFSGLLIALAFDALSRGRFLGTGLLAGLSVAVRTGNIIAVPAFVLGACVEPRLKNSKDVLQRLPRLFQLGFAFMPGLALAAYCILLLTKGQAASNTGSFSLGYFPEMFPAYALSLLVLYPGMLFAPLFYRGPNRWTLTALCYGIVLLYSFWFYRDTGSNAAETLIVGQRYMLAVLPLFLLAYAEVIWRLVGMRFTVTPEGRTLGRVGVAVGAVLLFAAGTAVQKRHESFLVILAGVRDQIYAATRPEDRVYCNLNVAKLLHPAWGKRDVILVNNVEQAERDAEQWLARSSAEHSSGRVVVAYWARPGRALEQAEANKVADFGRLLAAAPLVKIQNTRDSSDLKILTLVPRVSSGRKVP